jgi:hypothetical protein
VVRWRGASRSRLRTADASRNVWFLKQVEFSTDYRTPPARVAAGRKLSRAKIENLPRLGQ